MHHRLLFRTLRFVETGNVFSFLASLIVLGLFLVGNYQEFLDSSQFMLLDILSVTSIVCGITGLYYLIALTVWMVRRRHLIVLRFLYGILATAIGSALTLTLSLLEAIASPV